MSRGDPKLAVINIRRDHFLIAPLAVFSADKIHESVVDVSSTRKEETAARAKLMKEEELLILKVEREMCVCVCVRLCVCVMFLSNNTILQQCQTVSSEHSFRPSL